jgi:hypothetical protein
MIGMGPAADAANEGGPLPGNVWSGDQGMQDVTRRLSRSATIALLLSPVGLLLIAVTRLLIISDYNPVTATAIVSSGGYVDTLLGTVIPLVPIIMPYLALLLLFLARVIPGILALLAAAFVSPMAMSRPAALKLAEEDWHLIVNEHLLIVILMILLAIAFSCLLLVELGLGFKVFIKTVATVVCIALIPYVSRLYPFPAGHNYYAALIRQPWLPAETITLSSGQAFTGYTLSDDGDWVVVLKDDNRTIYYYRASNVAKLQVCQMAQTSLMQPLITLVHAGAHAPSRTPLCGASSAGRPAPHQPGGPAIPANGDQPIAFAIPAHQPAALARPSGDGAAVTTSGGKGQ